MKKRSRFLEKMNNDPDRIADFDADLVLAIMLSPLNVRGPGKMAADALCRMIKVDPIKFCYMAYTHMNPDYYLFMKKIYDRS